MSKAENYLLAFWLIVNLIVGALTVHEYGMSIDEPNNYRYAGDTLNAYPSLFGLRYDPNYDSSYDGHGPAFVTIAALFVSLVQAVFPRVFAADLWHYTYFITFQLTGLCLYWLTRRWFSIWTAWGVLLLFGTQPVMLGHSFINPKDIPFTFFLTLSIVWGFRMVDALEAGGSFLSLQRPVQTLEHRFRESDPRRRKKFLTLLSLGIAAAFVLILFSQQINALIEAMVISLYRAEPGSWAGQLFASVSSSNVPAEDYVSKALRLFDRVERGFLAVSALFFLAYFALLVRNTTLRAFLQDTWAQRHKVQEGATSLAQSLKNSLQAASLKLWFAEFFRALRSPHVLLAGVALGLATGVRAIGPIAGVIVVLSIFSRDRSKAWPKVAAYFAVSVLITYIAWPRLWDAPVTRYLEALGIASNFPHFPGRVLFNGEMYGPSALPLSYLPTLFSIQLTEPLVLGIYVGVAVCLWQLLRNRLPTDLTLYVGVGFFIPLLGLLAIRSPLYHNFRQVLFLIPPLVMLAAFPLERLFNVMTQTWLRLLVIVVLALPGIYATVKLYPYEYVYYNSFIGGPSGAVNRYELDYWRISLREMALAMNEIASPGSVIIVTRSAGLFARYARPDLVVDKTIDSTLDLSGGYDYVVQVARWEKWDLYPEIENLIAIERAGVVLASAKDVRHVSRK